MRYIYICVCVCGRVYVCVCVCAQSIFGCIFIYVYASDNTLGGVLPTHIGLSKLIDKGMMTAIITWGLGFTCLRDCMNPQVTNPC